MDDRVLPSENMSVCNQFGGYNIFRGISAPKKIYFAPPQKRIPRRQPPGPSPPPLVGEPPPSWDFQSKKPTPAPWFCGGPLDFPRFSGIVTLCL